jgi:hypothetical protein
MSNNKVYCKVCTRSILVKNIGAHLLGDSHLANVKKDKEKDKDKTRCKICKRPILNRNMDKHILSHQNDNKPNKIIQFTSHYKSLNKPFEKIEDMIKNKSNLNIKKEFGSKDKITTILIRFENPEFSTVTEYRESLLEFHKIIKEVLPVKISLSAKALFTKEQIDLTHSIQSHPINILVEHKIDEVLNLCFNFVDIQIQERYFQGSGLSLKKLLFMDLNIYRTKNKRGGTYCKLPFISHSIINVQNDDNKCFLWSILASKYPPKINVSKVTSYKIFENEIEIDSFPVHTNDIKQIEHDNNLNINVFLLKFNKSLEEVKIEDCELEPLYLSKNYDEAINLLLYQDHYMYIKNINTFFKLSETNSCHLCLRCLNSFSSKEVLTNHKLKCEQHEYCKLVFPKNAKLEFTKHNYRNRIPFVIYADFESISETIYGPDNSANNMPKTKKLKQQSPSAVGILIKSDHEEIIPTQYISYFNEDREGQTKSDVIEDFCKFLIDIEYRFSQIFTTDLKMKITPEETLLFENAKTCYYCDQKFEDPESSTKLNRETPALLELEKLEEYELCGQIKSLTELGYEDPERQALLETEDFEEVEEYDFEDGETSALLNGETSALLNGETSALLNGENGFEDFKKSKKSLIEKRQQSWIKVRDHDHLTSRYRGAAHSKCNILARKDKFIPIFFHNLSNYDAHLFIKRLTEKINYHPDKTKRQIKILAKNSEEYISFQFGCLRFLDSYRFLQASLDNATKSMEDKDFKLTRICYPNEPDFQLLRKKGSVPYSFYTSHESFNETNLTYEMFFNDLKDEMESEETYLKAKKIWDNFNCRNHREFISLYLKSDVLLLADCFEKFRDVNMKNFKIDPCHCYSVPGLTWQAGLKFTKIKLDLLDNSDDVLFFEKSIRGGFSGVMGSRYACADKYNKLLYVDANNLYGWAMMEPQPCSNFKNYIPDHDLTKEEILAISDDSELGFFLEVDLDYPENIKFKSKNFPYCPESIFIKDEDLSPYQKNLIIKLNLKRPKTKKLIMSQTDKKNYIVHYRMLKFYLNQGMILKKVHRVISFTQRKWLAPYIDFNTKQRMKATTEFEKGFFKLMNNAYYGKTCENIRNRKDVKLVSDPDIAAKYHSKPNFSDENIFDENLTAMLFRITSMKFNKPIYIGATVLELSKLLMYEFYYKTLQPYFGEKNIEIIYGDSVTSDTPIILKYMDNIIIKRISEIITDQEYYYQPYRGEKEIIQLQIPFEVWTANGWKILHNIIRHKTNKKIYRVRTKLGFVDVTEDHSLLRQNGQKIKPLDLKIGDELLHSRFFPRNPNLTFDDILYNIYENEPQTLEEKEYFLKGFFMGDGTSGIYHYIKGTKCSWSLSNQDLNLLKRFQKYCNEVYPHVNFKIYDTMKSSSVYKLNAGCKFMAEKYEEFYCPAIVKSNVSTKEKQVPYYLFDSPYNLRIWFFLGFYAADGAKKYSRQKQISFSQKGKLAISGLNLLASSLGFNMNVSIRKDKPNIFKLTHTKKDLTEEVKHIYEVSNCSDYVYDLTTEDHTFNSGFPLIISNTDSLVLKIKTTDLNKDLEELKDNFDFSNYSKDHVLYDSSKKKVPGYFKDELAGEEMTEFIALRSKMYSYKFSKKSEAKKLKGISRYVVEKKITFNDYKNTLFNQQTYEHKTRSLRSNKHEMYLQEVTKSSLSPFDDKRYILNDGISTIPFGYSELI